MQALIVNDTHAAVIRSSGTTLQTAAALRQRVLDNFENLIMAHLDKPLIHAGDLLDRFDVPRADILQVFRVLSKWLTASGQPLVLIKGNHDSNPRADKLSAWEFLCNILVAQFNDQVTIVGGELTQLEPKVYALGHCDNQDIMDMHLERALELENSVLIAHANYDNHFAEHSDHSLNISEEWAKEFVAKGNRLYSGHEHQKRTLLKGGVVMFGTQDATSIADCLGNDAKYAHILEDNGSLTSIKTMDVSEEFVQVDWEGLASVGDQSFVRVTGQVAQAQAGEVVTAIAKYRSKSPALIITNAVRVAGINNIEDFDGVSLEMIQGFNIREELLALFNPAERKVLEAVLDDSVTSVMASSTPEQQHPLVQEFIDETGVNDLRLMQR